MNLFMMGNALGGEPFRQPTRYLPQAMGTDALDCCANSFDSLHPVRFERNPIATGNCSPTPTPVAYCPFAYGYSNYSRAGYASHILHAGRLVSFDGKPLRSTLGGAGLAISKHCKTPSEALAYADVRC